jgi:sugar O-acyltransferase (sialic acid O-acetyltransferase NeuD family)
VLDYKTNNTIIVGYSGHSYVVIDALLLSQNNIIGYFEKEKQINNPFNLDYLGDENEFDLNSLPTTTHFFPAIGSNSVRKKLIHYFEKNNLKQFVLQHPKSIIAQSSEVGKSTLISAGVIINPLAKIGKGCIINTGSIIEHECIINDFVHIAPGTVLAGNVRIGTESFIGANSVVKQGVVIGKNVTIGAGSVVLKDIPDNETWVGNPAKKIK